MKRILVAFDDSPGADAAMRDLAGAGLPQLCEAKVLTIADVWLPPDASAPAPDRVTTTRGEMRQRALDALTAAREISVRGAERLRTFFPSWNIEHAACADSPAWAILAQARKWPADLIVIGSHGRSPLQKFFLGSVSYKVAAEAVCSVRVFKARHREQGQGVRVLVAVDGSSDSERAIEEVLARKWPVDSKFQLVTVLDHRLRFAALSSFSSASTERGPEEKLAGMLKDRAELFVKRQFEVSTQVLEGDPKAAILKQADAWEADGIFLGARGLEHGDRLYLGTLASAILTRAHCTVEIVRPSPPRQSSAV